MDCPLEAILNDQAGRAPVDVMVARIAAKEHRVPLL